MTLLDPDQFLIELGKLFMKSRTGGGKKSVSITLKHYDGHTKPYPRTDPMGAHYVGEDKCLFRARLANKKISTVVHAKEVNKFQLAYAAVLKANMDNLKKKERKPAAGTGAASGPLKPAGRRSSAKAH